MGSATYIIINYYYYYTSNWRYCDSRVFHLGRENVRGWGGPVNADTVVPFMLSHYMCCSM